MNDYIWFKPNPDAEAFKLRIRSPLECAPDRAFKRGGRFHIHPHHHLFADGDSPLSENPNEWNLISIKSIEPKVHTTFNRLQFTFADLDLKSRRTQTGESHHEFNNYIWRTADPDIVDLQLGGLQLNYEHEGNPRTYTADCVYLTADGRIFADEVKASHSYFIEPSYKARLKRVEADLAAVGIGFNRVVASHIKDLRVRRHNLTRAFLDRHTGFSQKQADCVASLIENSAGGAAMAEVEEALGADARLSRQIVHSMLCRRKLAFALDLPVSRHTKVMPAPIAGKLPDLRAIDL